MENHSHDRVCNLARDSSWFAYDFNLDFLRKIIFYLEVFSEICFSYCWTLISNIQYSHPICMRFKTARLRLAVLNPHTDLLLILYILLKRFIKLNIEIDKINIKIRKFALWYYKRVGSIHRNSLWSGFWSVTTRLNKNITSMV